MKTTVFSREVLQRWRVAMGVAMVVGLLIVGGLLVGFSRETVAADPVTPRVSINPDRTQVAPGSQLSVDIRVTNPFTLTKIERVRVKLDYDSRQITPISSDFDGDEDWVSDVTDRRISISFDDINIRKSRTGTIVFRVNQAIPGETTLKLRATLNWEVLDATGKVIARGSSKSSNDDVVVVAPHGVVQDPNVIDSPPAVRIEPQVGPTGTFFRAFASGFRAGELVSGWLNGPTGVIELGFERFANERGEVYPEFDSSRLGAGNYSLVLYGRESTQTLQISFRIEGTTAAPKPNLPPPPAPATPPTTNIEPKFGPAGTIFRAVATGFRPFEGISVWLNTPSGVANLSLDITANERGEAYPEFGSNGFAAGSYGLVVFGRESNRTVVIPFDVQGSTTKALSETTEVYDAPVEPVPPAVSEAPAEAPTEAPSEAPPATEEPVPAPPAPVAPTEGESTR
jgi:hypothetical protein